MLLDATLLTFAKVYLSRREPSAPLDSVNVTVKPPVARFTNSSIIFTDGSSLSSVDTVILATGYQYLVPFLSRTPSRSTIRDPILLVDALGATNSTNARKLTTNTRYIYPLYQDMFPLTASLPPTALAFVGLPIVLSNAPSDIAQSLYISYAIADPSILPSHADMLDTLVHREAERRSFGFDPYYVGHKMVGPEPTTWDYQDALVRHLKKLGKLPEDGREYAEPWRRDGRRYGSVLTRAWKRVVSLGTQEEWLKGVVTEDDWADLMERMTQWQEKWESEQGIPVDMDAYSIGIGLDDYSEY